MAAADAAWTANTSALHRYLHTNIELVMRSERWVADSVNRLQISYNEDSVSEAENGCEEVSMMQIVVDSNI